MNKQEKQAVGMAIATLMCLAKNSLSNTQTEMATRSAGELLWLLGAEKYVYEGRTFNAIKPDRGEIIDLDTAVKTITTDT